jgi:hypothetical protein
VRPHWFTHKVSDEAGETESAGRDYRNSPPLELFAVIRRWSDWNRLQPTWDLSSDTRYFGGQTMQKVADHFGVSVRNIQADWEFAHA